MVSLNLFRKYGTLLHYFTAILSLILPSSLFTIYLAVYLIVSIWDRQQREYLPAEGVSASRGSICQQRQYLPAEAVSASRGSICQQREYLPVSKTEPWPLILYSSLFFPCFSSVVRQMPGLHSQRRGTARTLPNCLLFVLFCRYLCCSVVIVLYCCYLFCSVIICVVLCIVCVYSITATECLPNCSGHIYHK